MTIFQTSCARRDGGAGDQGAGRQGRPLRQNRSWGCRPPSAGPTSLKTAERTVQSRRKGKGSRAKVSSHLNVGTVADAQKTLNRKMAKTKQPTQQLRTGLPRLSRAGLSACRLTFSAVIDLVNKK
uniref:Uncharacterized protein n=1 Tax=Molossus molossus TaxID=27622 RepID=A0A7J8ER73_MOLMO|nr:hypothetical protein HJG59_008636 [Molossus molossus]